MLRHCLITILLQFGMVNCFSQSLSTKLYNTTDGLSDNYIFCVYQDSYGYLWVGTPNGLNRYDGKRFTTYGLKNGLPSLYVDRVYEDCHHRLWIGTRRGMTELKGDSCYTYPINDKQDIYFVSGFFEPGDGRLWATTDKGVYELKGTSWVKVKLMPGKENNNVSKIIKTAYGLFINYDNNSLVQQNRDGSYKTILSVAAERPYYNSLFEKNDTVYICTYSGLQYWNGTSWIKRFSDTLKHKYIFTSFCDNNNSFWFGTKEDGVLVVSPGRNDTRYMHIPLTFNLVSNFYEDREKNIWIAGFRGLVKVSLSAYQTVYLKGKEKIRSIRNGILMPNGKMVISGDNGILSIVKPGWPVSSSLNLITRYRLRRPADFIDFYAFDEKERMWVTTREGELCRLDDNGITYFTSIVRFRNDLLRGIAYNKKTQRLFVCGDSVFLAGNENKLDTLFGLNKKQFIRMPYLVYLNETDGSMLVQTIEGGVYMVSAKGEIDSIGKGIDLYLSVRGHQMTENSGSDIWAVHAGKDISIYQWKPGARPELMETIGEQNGMPQNSFSNIGYDKNSRLWMSTAKGITVIQKNEDGNWIHDDFEIAGPGSPAPLSFAKFIGDKDGNMWVTLDDKLIVFDNAKLKTGASHTTTNIEQVLLFNRPTDWSSLADSVLTYRQLPVNPVLRYNQNSLSILFNGPLFNNNTQLEYSYRLLSSDTSWSDPTASNIVSFYQLSPGSYEFQVRSHIKGLDWGLPATFSFFIQKPFWETWWFRLLVIVAASALILAIFKFRIRQLKERSQLANQVRELEMKALKAQMNPHFIHNALNSIQSLIINNRSSEASHYISKFAKLLRQVLENADRNIISLDKELYSVQLYLELEKLRMMMEVEFVTDIDPEIIASEIRIPPLILQPFVENALWHGLSTKEGNKKITVSIREENNWIICEITDNGIGRKKAAEAAKTFPEGSFSRAVNITAQRLSDFNQSADPAPVRFIDLVKNDQPAGTTVVIRIKGR